MTNILIVEDDMIAAEGIAHDLRNLGYRVAGIATGGEEAVDMTGRLQPDLILMDIRLRAGMDGIEAADEIRRRHGLPVVYATAYSDASTLARAKITGPLGYVVKPIRKRDLATQVELALFKQRTDRELREAAEALQVEHNLLRALIDQLPDAVYVKDTDSRFTVANEAVARLMGVSDRSELLGKTDADFYGAERTREYAEDEKRIVDSGQPMINKDEPHVDDSGRHLTVLTTKLPMLDTRGNTIGLIGVSRDITERKEAQEEIERLNAMLKEHVEELREANQRLNEVLESVSRRLESLFENRHVLVVYLDADFNIVRVNRAYAEAHAKDTDAFSGMNYFTLYPGTAARDVFPRVLATGEPYSATAKPLELFESGQGQDTFWDWTVQPVTNEREQNDGLLLFMVDVTGRKRAQRARVVSERRFRHIVEHVDSIILRWKPDGTIAYANRYARSFFGLPEQGTVTAAQLGTLNDDDETPSSRFPVLDRIARHPEGQHHACEYEHQRGDGSRVWVHWNCRTIRNSKGEPEEILCVGADVTDHKLREQQMQRMQDHLRAFARRSGTLLHGRAASAGLAEGTALLYHPPEQGQTHRSIRREEVDSEIARVADALAASVREVKAFRERGSDGLAEKEMAIVDVHMALLQDPSLVDGCRRRIRTDLVAAEQAVGEQIRSMETMLRGLSQDLLRDREADIWDIGRRVLWNLRSDEESPSEILKSLPPGTVLVAERLLPSDTLQLDRRHVAAFVTVRNGPVSHAAILARAMGIPAVTDVRNAMSLLETGDRLLVDADAGTVIVAPTGNQEVRFAARRAQLVRPADVPSEMSGQCLTADGVPIGLYANLSQPDEVRLVHESGLDGVGLFRSEFLFLDVDVPPDMETQREAYSQVVHSVKPRTVVIRTMDLGGDKVPRFGQQASDSGWEHGRRGLAFSLSEKTMLQTQVSAILLAARDGNVRIMFPMVMGAADLRAALELVDACIEEAAVDRRPPLGAMIETPSAVFAIDDILELVDFVSIGTNDLATLTLAVERTSPDTQGSLTFLHPSVLRATQQVVEAAQGKGVELSVCGEAAGDPVTAALLVGMGVRNLSMSPFVAARLRQSLKEIHVDRAEAAVKAALTAVTPDEVRKIAERTLGAR